MSIQNLLNNDINSLDVLCNITGAITGTLVMNFKRLDNIVYCSFPGFLSSANNTQATISIQPTVIVDTKYRPVSQVSGSMSVYNNGVRVPGIWIVNANLTLFTLNIGSGGNFNTVSGFDSNTFVFNVASL